MKKLITICSDKYGIETTPDDLKPFVSKYTDKLRKLSIEFVDECVDKNIEICSAQGFFLSRSLGELTMAYSKKFLKDSRNNK